MSDYDVNNVKKNLGCMVGKKKTARIKKFAIIYCATGVSVDFATPRNHGKDMSSS